MQEGEERGKDSWLCMLHAISMEKFVRYWNQIWYFHKKYNQKLGMVVTRAVDKILDSRIMHLILHQVFFTDYDMVRREAYYQELVSKYEGKTDSNVDSRISFAVILNPIVSIALITGRLLRDCFDIVVSDKIVIVAFVVVPVVSFVAYYMLDKEKYREKHFKAFDKKFKKYTRRQKYTYCILSFLVIWGLIGSVFFTMILLK